MAKIRTPDGRINVLALLDMVAFSPQDVVDAGCGNAVLFVDAIQYRLECLERAYSAKRDWERACAEQDLKIREEARNNGDKITEGQIKAEILLDKDVAKLADEHHRAEVYEEYSRLITRVFEMRAEMLKTVANMVNREYPLSRMAEQAADRMQHERQKLRQRFPKE